MEPPHGPAVVLRVERAAALAPAGSTAAVCAAATARDVERDARSAARRGVAHDEL
ncbi:hypothetical protein HK405_007281 [Cladochytrium tenue]|nr:hypothetical protein HK405_007281 [Cladochytrium tenue]